MLTRRHIGDAVALRRDGNIDATCDREKEALTRRQLQRHSHDGPFSDSGRTEERPSSHGDRRGCNRCHRGEHPLRHAARARHAAPLSRARRRERPIRQRLPKRLRALEPVGGEFLKRLRHRGRHVQRHIPPQLRHRLHRLGDDLHDDLLRRARRVWRFAGKHLVEHACERVHIGARRDVLRRRRLLGAHVVRRAEGEARLRHAPARRRAHRERDAEVGHHRAAVVQQDVLGFDVAVDHAVLVRVMQRARHVGGDAHSVVHAELRLAIKLGPERLAVNERHHVEEKAVGGARIKQWQDVRMLERRRRRDLLHESLGAKHGGELGLQHLERDLALVLDVLGEIDRGHPALPKLTLDAVAIREG